MNRLLRAWAIHGQMYLVLNLNFCVCDVVATLGKKILFPDDGNEEEKWYGGHWVGSEGYHRPEMDVWGGKRVNVAKND